MKNKRTLSSFKSDKTKTIYKNENGTNLTSSHIF